MSNANGFLAKNLLYILISLLLLIGMSGPQPFTGKFC